MLSLITFENKNYKIISLFDILISTEFYIVIMTLMIK